MLDLVIRGGLVVTPAGAARWDVGVEGERIAVLAQPGTLSDAGRVVDATGKIVVPGGIEPHTHLAEFVSMRPEENEWTLGPEQDTRGMAFGGTTTHIDFCFVSPGMDLPAALEQRAARWKGNAYVDYAFHVGLTGRLPLKLFAQMPEVIQQGFPSFKVFTTDVFPPHPKRPSYRLDFGRIQLAMEQVARHGGIMAVHGEDDDLVQVNYEKFREEGRLDGVNLALIHNALAEHLAFRHTILLADAMGAAVYFVHVSAQESVGAVLEARGRGLPVYAETLHQYACFTAEDYGQPRGFCYHTYPSLKYADDHVALWRGLVGDGVSTTGTDEFPTSLEVKLRGRMADDITGGNVGAEARMGIVFTEGVAKRGMTLERFAAVTSTNAAKILGLYPKKGAIAAGSDADIVLVDPAVRKRLTRDDFHVSDYSPWEGWEVQGWPVTTILRGRMLVDNGRMVHDARDGQLVLRRIGADVLNRPVC